jgi:hypothetical protein
MTAKKDPPNIVHPTTMTKNRTNIQQSHCLQNSSHAINSKMQPHQIKYSLSNYPFFAHIKNPKTSPNYSLVPKTDVYLANTYSYKMSTTNCMTKIKHHQTTNQHAPPTTNAVFAAAYPQLLFATSPDRTSRDI